MSIFIKMLAIVLMSSLILVDAMKTESLVSFESEPPKEDLLGIYKSRCTRRFTPGNCLEPVQPVWTFSFEKQNCTERLGCANPLRANRFPSYGSCYRGCKILIDLYLQIMSYEERNDTSSILRDPSGKPPTRRAEPTELYPDWPPAPAEYQQGDEALMSKYMYEDMAGDETSFKLLDDEQ